MIIRVAIYQVYCTSNEGLSDLANLKNRKLVVLDRNLEAIISWLINIRSNETIIVKWR